MPGHLTAPPAKKPHCCSHPDIHDLCSFSSDRPFFPLYYFAPHLYDYRKIVNISSKKQNNEAVLRLDGIKSLVKGSVPGAPLPPTPVRWGAALFCCQPRLQSRENYYTQHRKCFLWQQLWKCHSSCTQPVCSSIIKRVIEWSFKKFTGSHFSWTKAKAPIIPQCWVHITQILYWSQPFFLTDADSPWEQKYEPWHYF